ncbi:MAG TPA: hypothetical protein PLN54_00625 [Flavobacteriales bacterium]|nr:hypothetical protein [Flavobacteriales bacterium]
MLSPSWTSISRRMMRSLVMRLPVICTPTTRSMNTLAESWATAPMASSTRARKAAQRRDVCDGVALAMPAVTG